MRRSRATRRPAHTSTPATRRSPSCSSARARRWTFEREFDDTIELRSRAQRRLARSTRRDNVQFDGLARVAHVTDATDWRVEYPFVVVTPDSEEEVARVVRDCMAAAAREKMILDYRGRISLKIRGLLRLPPNLKGNPEAVFKVRLLPNGEVLGVTLVKPSGQPAYDQEVERAILKASPLPLPPDREAAAAFRENLQLKFRPLEG